MPKPISRCYVGSEHSSYDCKSCKGRGLKDYPLTYFIINFFVAVYIFFIFKTHNWRYFKCVLYPSFRVNYTTTAITKDHAKYFFDLMIFYKYFQEEVTFCVSSRSSCSIQWQILLIMLCFPFQIGSNSISQLNEKLWSTTKCAVCPCAVRKRLHQLWTFFFQICVFYIFIPRMLYYQSDSDDSN